MMSSARLAVYRARYDYTPSSDEEKGCISFTEGDLLEVEKPIADLEGTEERPTG